MSAAPRRDAPSVLAPRQERVIGDVIGAAPVTIRPDQTLGVARSLMETLGLPHLAVVADRRVHGLLTAARVELLDARMRLDPFQIPVRAAMTTRVRLIESSAPVAEAVGRLHDEALDALFVVGAGRLLGVFTTRDALGVLRPRLAPAVR